MYKTIPWYANSIHCVNVKDLSNKNSFYTGVMVDAAQALKFAMDIAKGMQYLHSLDPFVPKLYIKSSHIMVIKYNFELKYE